MQPSCGPAVFYWLLFAVLVATEILSTAITVVVVRS
jgi:hypothetical protein